MPRFAPPPKYVQKNLRFLALEQATRELEAKVDAIRAEVARLEKLVEKQH